jgi:hypothetical protein
MAWRPLQAEHGQKRCEAILLLWRPTCDFLLDNFQVHDTSVVGWLDHPQAFNSVACSFNLQVVYVLRSNLSKARGKSRTSRDLCHRAAFSTLPQQCQRIQA